jgi:hypothetical protein
VKTLKFALVLGLLAAPVTAAAQNVSDIRMQVKLSGMDQMPGFANFSPLSGMELNVTTGAGGTPTPPPPPSGGGSGGGGGGSSTPTIVRYETVTVSRQAKTADGYPKETLSAPSPHTAELYADGKISANGIVYAGTASAGGKHTVSYNTCTRTTIYKIHIDLQKQDYAVYSNGTKTKSGSQYSAVEAEYPTPTYVTTTC